MTVCIAAIHNDGGIVGVSDKMFSTDTMAFEPRGTTKKVFCLAPGLFALNAGHVALQAEIMQLMQARNNNAKRANPDLIFSVKEATDAYVECYNQIKRKGITNSVLATYGLDYESFLSRQNELSPEFVRNITDKIDRFNLPEIETIIAGVDNSTGCVEPHIYSISINYYQISISCCDAIGYATIGTGSPHVNAYFMHSKFTRHFSLPKTIGLCSFAKRRAELAPNVGKDTDLFLIGPTLGYNTNLDGIADIKMLNEMYKNINENEQAVTEGAIEKLFQDLKDKLPVRGSPHDK